VYTWDSFGGKKVAFTVERIIQSFLLEELDKEKDIGKIQFVNKSFIF